jgi:hypothetical protein
VVIVNWVSCSINHIIVEKEKEKRVCEFFKVWIFWSKSKIMRG